jgi:hypothetical protein
VRRVLARVDPDALDQVIGRWLTDQQPPATQPAWRQAVAVDGKTLRGSGHHNSPQVHLLAAMDHTSRAVLGPGRAGRHHQRDRPLPASAGGAGLRRAGHDR